MNIPQGIQGQALGAAAHIEPVQIAKQAIDGMSLAARRNLMNVHMQGVDTAPILQNHVQAEFEKFQQRRAEFMADAAEDIQRIAAVSNQLAQELEAGGYLNSLEIQIQTLSQAAQDLKPVAEKLSGAVHTAQMSVQERNAKIQALTAYLNLLQKNLTSSESRQIAVTMGIYSVGNNVARYAVGMDYAPSPSNKDITGGPNFYNV